MSDSFFVGGGQIAAHMSPAPTAPSVVLDGIAPPDLYRTLVAVKQIALSMRYAQLVQEVTLRSAWDWKAVLAHRTSLLEGSVLANDLRTMFVLLRAMKPYMPRKKHRLRGADAKTASGFVEEQQVAKQHCSGVLAG